MTYDTEVACLSHGHAVLAALALVAVVMYTVSSAYVGPFYQDDHTGQQVAVVKKTYTVLVRLAKVGDTGAEMAGRCVLWLRLVAHHC